MSISLCKKSWEQCDGSPRKKKKVKEKETQQFPPGFNQFNCCEEKRKEKKKRKLTGPLVFASSFSFFFHSLASSLALLRIAAEYSDFGLGFSSFSFPFPFLFPFLVCVCVEKMWKFSSFTWNGKKERKWGVEEGKTEWVTSFAWFSSSLLAFAWPCFL